MAEVVGVIPARFGSTRFPGKPLHPIAGKPLLQWVIEAVSESPVLSHLLVATDHPDIQALVKGLGVEAVMTPSDLPSGSDRVWQAVKERHCDIVVNIQGDEPLISAEVLEALVNPLLEDPACQMATLARLFLTSDEVKNSNTAKIVLNHRHEALYFSRHAIPYSRSGWDQGALGCVKHIGLYAYRRDFLREFCATPPCELELAEGLEQLRALYLGAKIRVTTVEHDSWGVDTPEDVLKIEALLKERM